MFISSHFSNEISDDGEEKRRDMMDFSPSQTHAVRPVSSSVNHPRFELAQVKNKAPLLSQVEVGNWSDYNLQTAVPNGKMVVSFLVRSETYNQSPSENQSIGKHRTEWYSIRGRRERKKNSSACNRRNEMRTKVDVSFLFHKHNIFSLMGEEDLLLLWLFTPTGPLVKTVMHICVDWLQCANDSIVSSDQTNTLRTTSSIWDQKRQRPAPPTTSQAMIDIPVSSDNLPHRISLIG